MADHLYLSIGEVLGLLLEEFPDITISKIRFLESQGLIEPERTPSGYRKFYDGDVELLRAILHEQRANFLPLKVIRDRIESGAIDSDTTGGRTPPRGIRNVESSEQIRARDDQSREHQPLAAGARDSVFRRTDGGPEWAGGRALIPGVNDPSVNSNGGSDQGLTAPITDAVPVVPAAPPTSSVAGSREIAAPGATTETSASGAVVANDPEQATRTTQTMQSKPHPPTTRANPGTVVAAIIEPRPDSRPDSRSAPVATTSVGSEGSSAADSARPAVATTTAPPSASRKAAASDSARPRAATAAGAGAVRTSDSPGRVAAVGRELPYSSVELCEAASITAAQLAELQEYAIVSSRGSGPDTSFRPEAVEIARIAAQLLAEGIDARHLRAWRQSAERESALFEQRIMPLLRQRNPQARQSALDSLSELTGLGARLHDALVDSLLRHHFDGS